MLTQSADYDELASELNATLDFEDFDAPPAPGIALRGLIRRQGITLGETLEGLSVTVVPGPNKTGGKFDALIGKPTAMVALPDAVGNDFAVAQHEGFDSAALYAVGPKGFPDPGALGEGTMAAVFDTDQHAFGLKIHAARVDGTDPDPVRAFLMVFDRDAKLIGFQFIELKRGVVALGWRTRNNQKAIAGFTLAPDDPDGYALDDIIFDVPLQG